MERTFTRRMHDMWLDAFIDDIVASDKDKVRRREIIDTVDDVLNGLVGQPICPCQSPDYVLLDNTKGVAKVARLASQAIKAGKKPILRIAFVRSWRQAFDSSHPTFIGDYSRCESNETISFLNEVKRIVRDFPEFCDDPLASSLVLSIEGWDDVYAISKRKGSCMRDTYEDFSRTIRDVLASKEYKAVIPAPVRRINPNIGYMLLAFRAIVKRYNYGAKKTRAYPPVKIPSYIMDL